MEEGDADVCSQVVNTEPADGIWSCRLDSRLVVYMAWKDLVGKYGIIFEGALNFIRLFILYFVTAIFPFQNKCHGRHRPIYHNIREPYIPPKNLYPTPEIPHTSLLT